MENKKYRILVLLAHPSLHHSVVNHHLKNVVDKIEGVTLHDLYDAYPDFYIDMKFEQQLLIRHDLIVFQHPFYWYSTPPILKLWQDVVLSRGFAYGEAGTFLQGKDFLQVISAGGKQEAYRSDGYNGFSMDELLAPMKATMKMCGLNFHQPLLLHQSYEVADSKLTAHGDSYKKLLLNYIQNGTDSFKLESR